MSTYQLRSREIGYSPTVPTSNSNVLKLVYSIYPIRLWNIWPTRKCHWSRLSYNLTWASGKSPKDARAYKRKSFRFCFLSLKGQKLTGWHIIASGSVTVHRCVLAIGVSDAAGRVSATTGRVTVPNSRFLFSYTSLWGSQTPSCLFQEIIRRIGNLVLMKCYFFFPPVTILAIQLVAFKLEMYKYIFRDSSF